MDADWWVDRLYYFANALDVTVIATEISRTVIDVNRDPESRSLYPGMATTELVPTTTFDGIELYELNRMPSSEEQTLRREKYFAPYHHAIRTELNRLRALHARVVLYDAHSIRSCVPRLFDGTLPVFNIGTYDGRSCSSLLTERVENICHSSHQSYIVNGRFKGGSITRTYGEPAREIHAIQMELACRAYLREPEGELNESNWPPAYSLDEARSVRHILQQVLEQCLEFASTAGAGS
jgi:formiminoglutamase